MAAKVLEENPNLKGYNFCTNQITADEVLDAHLEMREKEDMAVVGFDAKGRRKQKESDQKRKKEAGDCAQISLQHGICHSGSMQQPGLSWGWRMIQLSIRGIRQLIHSQSLDDEAGTYTSKIKSN